MTVESSAEGFCVVARPNCSLSAKGMVRAVALISLFSLVVAIGFSLAGAWLVLPFAGLELLALAYAFYYVHCHAGDYESITIAGDSLAVEKRHYKNISRTEFNRYWAQVLICELPGGDQLLLLRSHGKEVEFGRNFMNNDQRLALAKELKKLVGAVL